MQIVILFVTITAHCVFFIQCAIWSTFNMHNKFQPNVLFKWQFSEKNKLYSAHVLKIYCCFLFCVVSFLLPFTIESDVDVITAYASVDCVVITIEKKKMIFSAPLHCFQNILFFILLQIKACLILQWIKRNRQSFKNRIAHISYKELPKYDCF